ncbi:MAG: VWA domain-containing protein [Desulfobacterales bacterium]|jgi:Ca-activated chloride channel family protein|nr:VWA domain-containing protein [Desulfobacterales bacterium]
MHFHSPWVLLLLLLIPVILFVKRFRYKTGAIRFSSTLHAEKTGKSLRQRLAILPLALRVAALVFLIIALARPQTGREEVRDISKGIAIEMVVDRSGSMGAEMEYKGKTVNRLEVVKEMFLDFVMGNGADLPGRVNDLIGMIAFARYPDTVCPLTLAHGALPLFVKNTQIVTQKAEDGTAIGDALALAAARLKTAESTLEKQHGKTDDSYQIKSKIIILLSDGQNNAGKRTPMEAAELAKQWGIKVYTIAIGDGGAMASIRTPFGVYKVPSVSEVDTDTLKSIAETTGGFFREADSAESLAAVYKEIDQLEKTHIESVRYIDYTENFLPFALAGLMFLAAEICLSNTLFRKIP